MSRSLCFLLFISFLTACSVGTNAQAAPLVVFAQDGGCHLENEFIAVEINNSGEMKSLRQGPGPNLIDLGYFTGPYLKDRSGVQGRLVRNTTEIGEVAYAFRASNLDLDVHYVMKPGTRGIYCYLELTHDPKHGKSDDELGFFKHVIKADEKKFTFLQSTDTEQGFPPPESAIARVIGNPSDHTYALKPSKFDNLYSKNYYSKYDYMQYAREHAVYGLYSPTSQTGLYVIHGGLEWTPGGPTKSLQTVHNDAVINTIINDEHMLQNFFQVNRYPANEVWHKLAGPFLIYINNHPSAAEAWSDAKTVALHEAEQWPYTWMQDPDYPLTRGKVSGKLDVSGGSPEGAWCVLADPSCDWQDQCLGYIYWTRAEPDGSFAFDHVRPGTYSVYAYSGGSAKPREANLFNDFKSPPFHVPEGKTMTKLGSLAWTAERHGEKLFQIGVPDRSTREFKFGNLRRQYGLWEKVPSKLDYTVPPATTDESERIAYDAEHWPYLESESGSEWRIHFTCQRTPSPGQKAWLTLAVIGTCKRPELAVRANGHEIWRSGENGTKPQVIFGDDASVRRCAVNGAYYHYVDIPFDAALLKKSTDNVLSLTVAIPGKNKEAGGIMYDALKLELEGSDGS